MADLFDGRPITLAEQADAARREVRQRERAYPRWVAAGRMTQAKADHELAAMRAIVETLSDLAGRSS